MVWNIGNWSPICNSKIGNGNSLKRNEKPLIPHKILFHESVHSVASPSPLRPPTRTCCQSQYQFNVYILESVNVYDHWPLAIQLKDYHQRSEIAKNEEKKLNV